MEVNKQLVVDWIIALRSGQYTQGRNALRRREDDRFCCLGVLCDVSHIGTWKVTNDAEYPTKARRYDYYVPNSDDRDRSGVLPSTLRSFVGLSAYGTPQITWHNWPFRDAFGETVSLVDVNDNFRYSFDEIADGLEKYYTALGVITKEDLHGQHAST